MTTAGSEESGYTLTRDFAVAMIEHFKAQKLIHRRFAFQILLQVCLACKVTVWWIQLTPASCAVCLSGCDRVGCHPTNTL